MSSKLVYILRHGQTDQNIKRVVQGRSVNSDLNETGIKQAQQFYSNYQHIPFEILYSSSLKRSYQTIQYFENETRKIIQDDRLDEICWGEHEGKGGEPHLMEKYYKIVNDWSHGQYNSRPVDGESAQELLDRCKSFMNDLALLKFEHALVCTHGRTLRALICFLKSIPLSNMEKILQINTVLYIAQFSSNHWQLLHEGLTSHLHKD